MSRINKSSRAIAVVPYFPLVGADVKGWTIRALVAVLCLGSMLMLTASRIETTRLRYELSELHQLRQGLIADVGRLNLEISAVARPQRIEKLARAMGLIVPRGDQVLVMNE